MNNGILALFPAPKIQLFCGDCLHVMPTIEERSVDLVLADPPYGTTACEWDSIIPMKPLWEQLSRIIKSDGVIAMMASQPFTSRLVLSNEKWFRYGWVWNKNGGANFFNLRNRPVKTHEDVLIFSPSSHFTFNPKRVARTESSLKRDKPGKDRKIRAGERVIEHYGKKQVAGLYGGFQADGLRHPVDIITFSVHEKGRYCFKFPTKKPVKLCAYLIETYTIEGDTVLDFCMGSGSTGVAAKRLNRHFIGIEKSKEAFDLATKRIEEGT